MDSSSEVDSVLNGSLCPICGHGLYWDATVVHDEDTNSDHVTLVSGCCGEVWKYRVVDYAAVEKVG